MAGGQSLAITYRQVTDLIPYARNSRTHTDEQVAQIAGSIREFGWTNAVYEPFSGSGTTIIAGEMTGRCVHAIELNPAYVDVAVIRWQEFTGKAATLEGDGRTFAELKAERHG